MRYSKRKLVATALAVVLTLGIAGGAVHAADRADQLFGRIRTVYNVVNAWHKDGADLDKFTSGAIKGGLEALGDPYTNYFSPDEFSSFIGGLNGTFSGIGAYLEQDDNYITISAPIKGGPAAKVGLKSGDRLLEANGVPLVGTTTEKAVKVIRGEAGTTVTLKVERPSESRTFTVTVTREVVNIPEVESRMLEAGVGYIQITSFGDNAADDFFKAVDALKAQGAKSLVLDLRQNPGGYLDAAVKIAGGFVPAGKPVVWEVSKSGKSSVDSSGQLINLPTAVLVDNGSASASEILSGALQDYGAAQLVGVKTFGKGTVQQILSLTDGSGMKVTVAEYLTPKERHVHHIGLTPDYVVENPKPAAERTAPLEYKRMLTTVSVGLDVLYLQYRLADLGYDPDVDGFFGLRTANAVEKFARANGLTSESRVDEQFIHVLNQKVEEHTRSVNLDDAQLKKAVEVVKAKTAQ